MDFGALAVFGFHPKIYLLFTKTDSNNYSRRLKVCTEYTACMHGNNYSRRLKVCTEYTVYTWMLPLSPLDGSKVYPLDLGKTFKPLPQHQLISISSDKKGLLPCGLALMRTSVLEMILFNTGHIHCTAQGHSLLVFSRLDTEYDEWIRSRPI